jgi:hypothetical protein
MMTSSTTYALNLGSSAHICKTILAYTHNGKRSRLMCTVRILATVTLVYITAIYDGQVETLLN